MRAALRSQDMGVILRVYRHHPAHGPRGLPQTEIARWLGVTQGQLSRIENGRSRVRDLDKLIKYARLLGIPEELLWFEVADNHMEPAPSPDALVLPNGSKIATSVPSRILAESLLDTLDQYVRTDMVTGPFSLLPVVGEQLRFVEGLEQAGGRADREKLRVVHARFAEFLGWLHQDTGNLRAADKWTASAWAIACETEDFRLHSYIRSRQSNIAADRGRPKATIDLAESALDQATALSPRLRAVALRQLAHGYAQLGRARECDVALRQATDQSATAAADDNDLARYCTPEFIAMEAADCWIDLGRPHHAIAALEQSLPCWLPQNRRDLGRGLSLLALAYARTGQPDQALATARHALMIVLQTHSTRTERELYRVIRELRTSGSEHHATELRSALHAILS
ncbi:helix-turn-helix domain-containing protein [Nocardia brasiliensis]|uniref:helix-turn-helix domain-containing protein n=1 Tax=Nocardia brasiliensis TaxID=37326 RepID=UPI002457C28C|nr:helix-turn-helix transcriptional regulator [Nocardia brasiliensis]